MVSLVISQGVTDLLASHDMVLVSEQRATTLFYIKFEWAKWDNVTTGGKSVVFWRREGEGGHKRKRRSHIGARFSNEGTYD